MGISGARGGGAPTQRQQTRHKRCQSGHSQDGADGAGGLDAQQQQHAHCVPRAKRAAAVVHGALGDVPRVLREGEWERWQAKRKGIRERDAGEQVSAKSVHEEIAGK